MSLAQIKNSGTISGCTILRNGVIFDFPFTESILSILSICNEFIICVGKSDDNTKQVLLEFVQELPETERNKIKIIDTVWPINDKTKRIGGQILAEQTNLAILQCTMDWIFYLQADEVVHEEDLVTIKSACQSYVKNKEVEAFVFNYRHFYGNYKTIQTSRSSYRREIRIIRNQIKASSTGDAQSFRIQGTEKLKAVLINARIFHYGWVRPQSTMKKKTAFMDTLYHQNSSQEQPATGNNYSYKKIIGLKPFKETHPKVMQNRIRNSEHFDFSDAPRVFSIKDFWKLISGYIESASGYRPFEFKNYRLIGKFPGQK